MRKKTKKQTKKETKKEEKKPAGLKTSTLLHNLENPQIPGNSCERGDRQGQIDAVGPVAPEL